MVFKIILTIRKIICVPKQQLERIGMKFTNVLIPSVKATILIVLQHWNKKNHIYLSIDGQENLKESQIRKEKSISTMYIDTLFIQL